MQLILIAGGQSSRLKPLVSPKSLLPFCGKTLLEWTLLDAAQLRCNQIIVVGNHHFLPAFQAITDKFSHVTLIEQPQPKGISDAVSLAAQHLDPQQPTIIANVSSLNHPRQFSSFASLIATHADSILLTAKKIEGYKPGGYLQLNSADQAIGVVEQPNSDQLPSQLYKLMLDYFPQLDNLLAQFATLPTTDGAYETALSAVISRQPAQVLVTKDQHASLKYPHQVLDVMEQCLAERLVPGIDPAATIHPSAILTGPIQIEAGVKIGEHAVIKGPVYLGQNVVIGTGALIRQSSIESQSKIGFNSEIARSYVGQKVSCHTAFVGDSVVEGHSNLAAGTITANLRFDQKNVIITIPKGKIETHRRKLGAIMAKGAQTGIHASLMPGTVLGPDVIVAAGTTVHGLILSEAS